MIVDDIKRTIKTSAPTFKNIYTVLNSIPKNELIPSLEVDLEAWINKCAEPITVDSAFIVKDILMILRDKSMNSEDAPACDSYLSIMNVLSNRLVLTEYKDATLDTNSMFIILIMADTFPYPGIHKFDILYKACPESQILSYLLMLLVNCMDFSSGFNCDDILNMGISTLNSGIELIKEGKLFEDMIKELYPAELSTPNTLTPTIVAFWGFMLRLCNDHITNKFDMLQNVYRNYRDDAINEKICDFAEIVSKASMFKGLTDTDDIETLTRDCLAIYRRAFENISVDSRPHELTILNGKLNVELIGLASFMMNNGAASSLDECKMFFKECGKIYHSIYYNETFEEEWIRSAILDIDTALQDEVASHMISKYILTLPEFELFKEINPTLPNPIKDFIEGKIIEENSQDVATEEFHDDAEAMHKAEKDRLKKKKKKDLPKDEEDEEEEPQEDDEDEEEDNPEDEEENDDPAADYNSDVEIDARQSRKGYDKKSKRISNADRKIYKAYKNYKNNEAKVDSQLSKMINDMRYMYKQNRTQKIIEGKAFSPMGILKKALGTAAIFSCSKIGGILYLITKFTLGKNRDKQERKRICIELEAELKMLDEKIEDARSDGNRKAKYALMRTRNEVQKAYDRIKFGLTATKASARGAARAITHPYNVRG